MVWALIVVLLAAAGVVAYPWAGLVVGGLVAGWVLVAVIAGRARVSRPPAIPAGRMSLQRRVAVRRAWQDLHGIEAASGLPPTPPTL